MKIDIKVTNIELTAPLREYIEDKIGGLEKFLVRFNTDSIFAAVDVGRSTNHHKQGEIFYTDVNLELPGKILRAKKESEDVRASIDAVKDAMQQSIKKYLGQQFEDHR
ncbi:MAG: ribosome-associated translation inhibitor RaiA [bacterium]